MCSECIVNWFRRINANNKVAERRGRPTTQYNCPDCREDVRRRPTVVVALQELLDHVVDQSGLEALPSVPHDIEEETWDEFFE